MPRESAVAAPPEKLSEWLRAIELLGCIRIEARHLEAGKEGGSVVSTFEIAEREDGGERFDGPAVNRRLEEDAQELGGVQRYVLLAFREGSKAPRDRLILRVDGGADGDASMSEGANAHGLVAQAHRHLEATMGLMLRVTGTAMTTLSDQNKFLAKALEKAQGEKVELWETLGDLAKLDKERDNHKHALTLKEKQADVIRDGIKLLIPGMLTKFGLGSTKAQEEGLSRFIESLTFDQQTQVFSVLSDEQKVALSGLLETLGKKKEQEESKEKNP